MFLLESLKSAWTILIRNKVRSFLTMLGIIIGVMAVVVIMSVGAGAQSLILNQIEGLGSNLVGILPGASEEDGPPAAAYGIVITTLTYEDGKALMSAGNPHILAVAPYVRGAETLSIEGNTLDTSFVGTSASYLDVENVTIANGRFFTEDEERSVAKVAVLGHEVAQELFGDTDPVGKTVKIKKTNVQVIGVVAERGTSGFQNQDNQIFVPVSTAQKLLLGINYVSFIRVKIDDPAYVDSSMRFMEDILRERHDLDVGEGDDFSVRSTQQGMESLTQITNALKFFLAAIAAISLVVGGIGIMNIMLAAVQERTKEIGLRKAIGAKSSQITQQFLVETVMITLTGGLIGIVLGVLISVTVAAVATAMGYSWDLVITPGSMIMGCVVSITIGLLFGITPARRASRLSPIEALRYE